MQSAFSVKVLRQLHTGRSGIVDVCSSCAIQKVARWTLPIESTPFKLSKARHSSTRNTVLDITPVETVKPINYQDKALKELSGLLSRASKIIDSETFQGSQDLISEDKAMAFDLDTIMNSLGYVDAGTLSSDQVVANLPNDTLGLTVDHYNMLLKHLLWNYVDAPPQYLSHHSSVLPKYLPGTSIPSDILKIANSLEEDMSFMSLKPNPLTLSYLILANTYNPQKLLSLWEIAQSQPLEPFAYTSLLYGFSHAHTLSQTTSIVTSSLASTPPDISRITKRMTWAVYGAAGKKRKAWMGTWEALLGVALKTQPMDLGMVAKAKAKVFAAKDEWRRESFGVVMDWVVELGDEGDLNRCLARMKAKRVRPTRAVRNAILKFWSLRFKPRSVLSHHSKCTTSSPDHTTHQYVMEAIYQLRQAADTSPSGYTDSTLNALRNDLHARVEIPLTTQLLNGDPLVGPATWDLLVACYARIGARDDAVRTFGVLKEMVEVWKEKGTYGFMKGEGIVLGSTLIDGMMVAFGGLRDVEGMEKLCGEFVFTRESIERHYKGFMRKMERSGGDANILEEPGRIKDEENDNEEVEIDEANSLKGTLEVDTPKIPTSILEVDPFEKSYKAFVEGWFESSEDEGDIVEVLRKLRQEEKKKVEEYGLKLPL